MTTFQELFEKHVMRDSQITEKVGVMSIDTLERLWEPVMLNCRGVEHSTLIAKSQDGKDVLIGRPGKREDGKFAVEVQIRAEIDSTGRFSSFQRWHISDKDFDEKFKLLSDTIEGRNV
jgi:hypothetical protein